MRTIFLWMSLQVAVSTLQSISRTVDTQPGQDKKRTFSKLYFLTRESEDKTQTRAMALLPTVKCEDEDDDRNFSCQISRAWHLPNLHIRWERTYMVYIYCDRRLTMPIESIYYLLKHFQTNISLWEYLKLKDFSLGTCLAISGLWSWIYLARDRYLHMSLVFMPQVQKYL